MDDTAKIETYKAGLRLLYAGNPNGLKAIVINLMNGAASDETVVIGQTFEGGSAQAQIVLEPLAKLNAALAVLAELDPTAAATLQAPSRVRYANFGCMATET